MSRLHTDSEIQVGDEYDIPSFNITRPTLTALPTLDLDDLNLDDPDELTDIIEQIFHENDLLLLPHEIPK